MFHINSPLFCIFKCQLSVFRDTACLHWFWSVMISLLLSCHIFLRLFLFISTLSQEMIVIYYSVYFYFEVLVHLVNNDTPQFIPLSIWGRMWPSLGFFIPFSIPSFSLWKSFSCIEWTFFWFICVLSVSYYLA